MPAQVVRLDPSAARAAAAAPDQQPQPSPSAWSPVSHRVYPDPASIPPHWQVHPASAAPYRDPHPRPSLPQGNGGGGNGLPPWARPHTQLVNGAYTRVLQVQPFVTPPPQPIPHKVWILDCKSCGTFLTNRGMKAVLLLRPNVPLYSTDALPINCSAFSPPSPEPLSPPHVPASSHAHSHSHSVSSVGSSSSSSRQTAPSSTRSSFSSSPSTELTSPAPAQTQAERPPSRTCECLTQTLCCHGCGGAVGYMIVAPCARCTSSITANNRATNGHRFVFYSSEIVACERRYVPGERGVGAVHPVPMQTASVSVHGSMAGLQIRTGTPTRQAQGQVQSQAYPSPTGSSPTSPSMPSLISSPVAPRVNRPTSVDYPADMTLPTPPSPTDSGSLSPSALAARARHPASQSASEGGGLPPVPPNSHSPSPHAVSTPTFADPVLPPSGSRSRARAASASAAGALSPAYASLNTSGISATAVRAQPAPEPLKAGEVLYWHHLLRSGEIPAVSEDPRARLGAEAQQEREREREREQRRRVKDEEGRRKTVGRRVLAGR